MVRSSFAYASYLPRGIFAIAVLSLVLGFVFHSQLPSRVMAQQPSESATAFAMSSTPEGAPAAATASDIFLELAATVGQTTSAKRLIDYKLKNDPTGSSRYFAIVDFDQPSTSKRFYVFDTV